MSDPGERVIERMRAVVRLLYPEEMTPMAKRVIESALDEEAELMRVGASNG